MRSPGVLRPSARSSARRRLWIVLALDSSSLNDAVLGIERPLAKRFGYVPASAHVFPSSAPLAVVEWAPPAELFPAAAGNITPRPTAG